MLLLSSATSLLQVITSHASQIEVHASYVDFIAGSEPAPDSVNTIITTATTTTVVGSPSGSNKRNIKHLNITNDHASQACTVTVEHTDGTNAVELMSFVLLSGENMVFNEEGRWVHRDAQGAEYPPAGLGSYSGKAIPFMKTGTSADAVGYWYCTSKDAGFPGAWSPGTSGVNGRVTNGQAASDAGCIPITNPDIGANYLTEVQMSSNVNHTHLFFDCLWVNNGLSVTTTGPQAISTPTLPPRDVNGTTNGEGCMIALLTTTANTNAAVISNATISYTNSDGVAGRTATLSAVVGSQIPATPAIGTLIWFNMQAGDKGVKSIGSISLGTSLGGGAISLMICRDIATIGTTVANVAAQKIIGKPGIRLYNDSCILHCIVAGSTAATFFSGELTVMEK